MWWIAFSFVGPYCLYVYVSLYKETFTVWAVVFCLVGLIMIAGLVMLGWSVMPQLREAIVTSLATQREHTEFPAGAREVDRTGVHCPDSDHGLGVLVQLQAGVGGYRYPSTSQRTNGQSHASRRRHLVWEARDAELVRGSCAITPTPICEQRLCVECTGARF